MSSRTSLRAGFGAAMLLACTSCQTSPPLSATPYKVLAHKAEVAVGASALGNFNTELRLDSNDVNVGTFLNAEQDLGLGSGTTVGNAYAQYRFNRRHRIDVSWQEIDREGSTRLTEEIDFVGITIPAVAITSSFNSTAVQTLYTYNFAVQERWEVGGQFGLTWTKLNIGISVDDDPLAVSADVFAPIPQFGLTGSFALTPKLKIGGTYQWLQILFGDYQGATSTTRIDLDYDITQNVGLGLGLVNFTTDADLTLGSVSGTLNYGYQGALLYLRGML